MPSATRALRRSTCAASRADSRTVKQGDLFVAVAGSKDDGLRFVAPAIAARRGRRSWPSACRRRRCRTASPSCRSAMRAARWRSRRRASFRASPRPSRPSPAPAARPPSPPSRARSGPRLGEQAASIGTIGLVTPKREVYGSLTTPDPVALHRSLDELARRGRDASRDRGLLARPRPAPPRRRAHRRRRLHQSSAATISTIIRRWKPISPPSCGCSPTWCSRAARR